MRSYHEQLQLHALKDLTNRAKSGILIYASIFLVLAYIFELHSTAPDFFYVNLAILCAILVSRIVHYIVMQMNRSQNVTLMNQWLVITVLLAALHWGLMCGWMVHSDDLIELRAIALITTPAFALGGACTLSISSEIRTLYPTLMFAPLIIALMAEGTTEGFTLAGLVSFALLYIFSATRTAHDDYWEAITNHMVAEERAELMEKLSTTDPLTQLKNRMYFDTEYVQEWKRSSRMKAKLSIVMLDLDFFKTINDTHGHMFGDECLRSVATVISDQARRPTDCAARYGGEEFVVILPNTDEKGARIIANRILDAVKGLRLKANGTSVSLTCSIGGATLVPDHQDHKDILIKQADEALYHAKNSGRARYCSFSDISPETHMA